MIYSEKADQYLTQFYQTANANTLEEKYIALTAVVGEHTFSHDPTLKQQVAILEHTLLHDIGMEEF